MANKRSITNKKNIDINDDLAFKSNTLNNIESTKSTIKSFLKNNLKVQSKNESQKKLINSINRNQITISAGPAGTGKTYVALATALNLLMNGDNKFDKIYLVKSVTTLKGEEVGFIKGDLMEKFEPTMLSYYINLEKLISKSTLRVLIEKEV